MTTRTPSSRSASWSSGGSLPAASDRLTTRGGQAPVARVTPSTTRARSGVPAPSTKTASAPASVNATHRLGRRRDALDAEGVGAGDDDDAAVRLHRRAHPRRRLGDVDDLLAGEVAAALRRDLVLEVQPGDAGGGVRPRGRPRLQRVAVAGVGVRQQRQPVQRRDDALRDPDDVGRVHEAEVGQAERDRGGDGARQVRTDDTGAGGQPGADRVVHPGRWTRSGPASSARSRSAGAFIATCRAGRTCPRRRRPGRR